MATNGGQVVFDVGFNVRGEQLKEAANDIKMIQSLVAEDFTFAGDTRPIHEIEAGLKSARQAATELGNAFDASFNKDLGVINITKFEQEILKSGRSLKEIGNDLSKAGAVGTDAFRKMATSILTTNTYVKQTDVLISKIATTLGNTLKWNISSSVINKITGSIQEAWGYTKALDGSLNDIQIVTNKSSEDMAKFAVQANNAAKALKTTTTAYTDAALTFYQQGLNDEDVAARAETSLKVSNVTGLSGDQSAEYVTAVLNGYKVAAEDAEEAMDKLAAVGAATASSLAELSEGMAKVASAANAMGVSEDQLAATLSTVISVTRQDASTVGTAFKTIYARISDIKAGTAEAEISLGNYTKKMAEMGFSVLDSTGNMRDLGEVIEEIGGKWANLSREQQISLAQTMAGTRQYNNLIALFDNWADYEDALNVSMQANGTLQKQQAIYAESLTAKLNGLKAAKEDVFDSFIDSNSMKEVISFFTIIIEKVADFIDAVGGGGVILKQLGAVLLTVFGKQISNTIATLATNIRGLFQNINNGAAQLRLAESLKGTNDTVINNLVASYQKLQPVLKTMTAEQAEQTMELIKQKAELDEIADKEEQIAIEKQKFLKNKGIQINKDNFSAVDYQKASNQINDIYANYEIKTFDEKDIVPLDAMASYTKQILNLKAEILEIDEKDTDAIEEKNQDMQELINSLNNSMADLGLYGFDKVFNIDDLSEISNFIKNNIEQLKTGNEEVLKELEQKWKDLVSKNKHETREVLEDFNQQNINKRKESKSKAGKAGKVLDNIVSDQELQSKTIKINKMISSIMQMSIAVQQFQQLGSIWSNEDTSLGEKIFATISAISMAMPGLIAMIQTYKSIQSMLAIKAVANASAEELLATVYAKGTGAKALSAAATERLTKLVGEDTAKQLINAKALDENTKELLENAIAKEKNADSTENLDKSSDGLKNKLNNLISKFKKTGSGLAETGVVAEGTSVALTETGVAAEGASAALTGTGVAAGEAGAAGGSAAVGIGAVGAALATVAAVAVAATAGFVIYKIAKGNAAKADKAAAAEAREYTEELREEKKQIDDICSTQEQLNEQLKKGEISIDSYRQKLHNLCNEYGLVDLAVKSLYMTEKELQEYYQQARDDINDELIEQDEKQLGLDKKAAVSNISKSAGSRSDNFGDTIDLKGMTEFKVLGQSTLNSSEQAFKEDMEAMGIDIDGSGHMDLEAFVDAYANNSEAMLDILNKYDIKATQQLLGYISENQEMFDSMAAAAEEKETLQLNKNLEERYQEGIHNTQEYRAAIEEEAKRAANEANPNLHEGDKEWDKYYEKMLKKAEQYYAQYDDMAQLHMQSEVVQKMDEANWSVKSGTKITQDQMEFLYLHLDTMAAFDSLDEFLAYYDDEIKLRNSEKGLDVINSFLTDEDRDSLSKDEISSLYAGNEGFEASSGYSMGEFQKLNWEDQKIAMLDYYQTAKMERMKYNEGVEATREVMAQEYDEETQLLSAKITADAKEDGLWQSLKNHKEEAVELAAKREAIEALTTEDINEQIQAMNTLAGQSVDNLSDLQDLKDKDVFKDDVNTEGIDEGKQAYNTRAEELYNASRMEELDTEEIRDYAHYLEDASNNSEILSEDLQDNLAACQDLAVQIKRMNKGVDTLSENWDEWSDILKNSSKESEEYADAMTGFKEAMADLLDVTEEFISDNFVTENMEDIAKAAEGDADAIDRLRASMLEDIVMHLDLDDSALSNEQLLGQVNNLQSMLDSMGDLQVGAEIDDASFIAACNEMIASAGLTSDQVNALFSGMGFNTNFSSETEPVPAKIPEYTVHHEPIVKGYANIGDGPSVPIYDEVTWTEQTGEHIAEGEAAAFAMTTDGSTPVINSVTKKAGGSMNNASSSNKGGGGKGGGGSKAKEPDKMDKIDNTIDRYHDINIEIKQLETAYDRLGKAQDKLVGQDLINNLNQQLKILEKQIDAYQRKLALERQEAAELQGDLSGKGVTFNADGTIANYAESLKAQEDYVNSLIEKYNNMSAEEQEAYKEVVEQAKEDFEKFKENIERYDTIITDEIPGLEDQIQDAIDQQIEINIKKFTMKVELRLEMKQAEEDWNKFKRKIIDGIKDENILGQGLEGLENLKDYFDLGDGTGTVQVLTDQVNNTMAEIEKIQNGRISDVYGNDLAAALEDLQKYNTELMTQLEDIDDLIADIEQGYLDTMDEVSENMEKQVEAYEYVNELIESDIELIKLLYGEDAYDSLGAYYSQKHDNYLKALDFDRKEVDFWEEEMNRAKEAGDTEAYNKALEKYRESVSRLNDDVKNSVQNIIDQYSNAINKTFDDLDKKFTGGKGLEFMQEEWELINTNADRYLDTINSTYEVQKLQGKYKDAIKNTDSTSAQKKLNALMEEEIGMLEKKDKLSQYDIDRANMKYEIALKQIALEEAQKNKSSMRMKRDAQGNYSYVYAGDEDDISSKQQELADAQNQLYNLDKGQYQQNLDDMMSYYAEFTDKYKALMLDTTISDEEREKKKAMLIEQYGALINSIQMDNETIRNNLSESTFDMLDLLYETDAASFEIMTGLNTNNWDTMSDAMINKIQTDLVPSWDSGVQGMINLIKEEGGLEPACKEAFEEIEKSVGDFKTGLAEVQEAAKISFDEIANGQDNTIDRNKELIEDNDEIIADAKEQLEAYQKLRAEVENLAKAYDGVRDAAIRAADAAHTLAEEINTQSANAQDDPIVGPNVPSNPSTPSGPSSPSGPGGTNSGGSGSSSGGSGSGGSASPKSSSPAKKYYVKASHPSYGTRTFGTFTSRWEAESYIVSNQSKLKYNGVLFKTPTISEGYKTGGYTGNWIGGLDKDGGRLAFLHQKELVLNAEDTENYLQAVQEMRKLQDEIQNGASMSILGTMFDAIADSINIRIADLQNQAEKSDFRRTEFGLESSSMSQNIVINADFPDVSDAAEIQKAFDQILGMASQKANNKSR